MIKNLFTRITTSSGTSNRKKSKQEFTIKNFVRLGNQLIQHHTNPAKIPLIIECIRSIAEILIWSDQNDHQQFFHVFLEMRLLKYFESVLWIDNTAPAPDHHSTTSGNFSTFSFHSGLLGKSRKRPRTQFSDSISTTTGNSSSLPPPIDERHNDDYDTISTLSEASSNITPQFAVAKQLLQKQLLQTLSIMIQNLSSKDSLYFILSNSYMNQFIKYRYDFQDEEVLDYYITFLKTISMRLDQATIQFFFVNNDLLLYQEAKKYMTVRESMIRIAVRTLILNIYSVNAPNIREYIIRDAPSYFGKMIRFLRSELVKLNQMVLDCRYSDLISTIDSSINEFQDYLYYFNDILELQIPEIKNIIESLLLRDLVVDFLLPSLEYEANDEDITTGRRIDSANASMDLWRTPLHHRDAAALVGGPGGESGIHSSTQSADEYTDTAAAEVESELTQEQSPSPTCNLGNGHTTAASTASQQNGSTPRIQNPNSHPTPPSPASPLARRKSKRLSSEEYHIRRCIQQAIILVEGRQHFRSLDQDYTEEDITQWHNQTKLIDRKIALLALGQIFLIFNSHHESKSILQKLENILMKHPKQRKFMEILRNCFSLYSDVPVLSAGASFVFILSNSALPTILKKWGLLPKRREREIKHNKLLDILSGTTEADATEAQETTNAALDQLVTSPLKTEVVATPQGMATPSPFPKSGATENDSADAIGKTDFGSPDDNHSTMSGPNVLSPGSPASSCNSSHLVDLILQRLNNRHSAPKRLLTVHLLCQLCYELTKLTSSSISVASRTRVRVKVTDQQKEVLESAVQLSKTQVMKHVGNDLLDLLPVFESEHLKYQQIRNLPWDRICGDAALIVEDVTSHLEYHRREPTSAVEEIRVNVHSYLALQNLNLIFKTGTSQRLNNLLDRLIDFSPSHRVGQEIPFDHVDACKGDFLIKDKRKDRRRLFERRFIFFDEKDFLITVSSTIRNGNVIVRSVTPLRHIRTRQHSKNANAMHLFAFTDRSAPMLRDIVVFGNPQSRQDVQNVIEENVARCLSRKVQLLDSIVNVGSVLDAAEEEDEKESYIGSPVSNHSVKSCEMTPPRADSCSVEHEDGYDPLSSHLVTPEGDPNVPGEDEEEEVHSEVNSFEGLDDDDDDDDGEEEQ